MKKDARTQIAINNELYRELKEFTKAKHGFLHGAIKVEVELAIKNHIFLTRKKQALSWILALTDVNYGDIKHRGGKKSQKDLDEVEKFKHEFSITDEEIKQMRVIEMEKVM